MRQDPEFFADQELILLYMAARLRDSLKVEGLLTDAGIDYLVETGTYTAGLLMRRDLTGAFFYVAGSDLEVTRDLLVQNGFKPYSSV